MASPRRHDDGNATISTLPNEMLADVFRWLDRRFLETKLRFVSKRANSLVKLLNKNGPIISSRTLNITASDRYVHFNLILSNDVNTVDENDIVNDVEKPFQVYDPSSVPSYLRFEHVSIGHQWAATDFAESFMELVDSDVVERTGLGMHNKQPSRRVEFVVKTPKHWQPSMLYEHSWGYRLKIIHYDLQRRPPPVDSRLLRTCSVLTFLECPSDIRPLVAWLRTPAEPCPWNPEPSPANVKHLDIYDRDGASLAICPAIVEDFQNSRRPSSFHAYLKIEYRPDRALPTVQPRRHWRNTKTGEVLCQESSKQEVYEIWRRPATSRTDYCYKCPEHPERWMGREN